jgi:hypothetical protein
MIWLFSGGGGGGGTPGPEGPTGPTGPTGPAGANGSNGAAGAAGATWVSAASEPDSSVGANGDFAIDMSTANVYQKAGGAWSLAGNIQGAPGAPGATGAAGPPGQPGPASAGTYLVAGGQVAWVTGLTYRISAAVYYIAGTKYTSSEAEITLDAADSTNPRIDVIALDAAGALAKIKGDAAADAAQPDVDPSLYVAVTFVYIPALATVVATSEVVYAEDAGSPTEWPVTPSAGTIVKNSTNNPRTGTKCVEGTSVTTTQSFTAVRSATFDLATRNILVFYIRLKAAWAANRVMRLRFYNSTVAKGVAVTIGGGAFGFNRSLTGAYQQIVVPLSVFGVTAGTLVDRLKVEFPGSGTNVGFYIDDMSVQSGIDQTIFAAPAIRWRGAWSATTSYALNDAVSLSGSSYLCLAGNLNQSPDVATAYWGMLAQAAGATTWTRMTYNATDYTGDGVNSGWDVSEPAADDDFYYKVEAGRMYIRAALWGTTIPYSDAYYLQMKIPAGYHIDRYNTIPCVMDSNANHYRAGVVYVDPTNVDTLNIYPTYESSPIPYSGNTIDVFLEIDFKVHAA